MNAWGRVPEETMREATCNECGHEYYRYYTNTKSRFCPACQEQRNLDRKKEEYIRHDHDAHNDRFTNRAGVCTVITDPSGDFKPGAKLFKCEIERMEKLGYVQKGFTYEHKGERRII